MYDNNNCPFCTSVLEEPSSKNISCKKCGNFEVVPPVIMELNTNNELEKYASKISSWISENNKLFQYEYPKIDKDKFEQIKIMRDKTIKEKFNCFMKTLSNMKNNNQLNINDFNHYYIYDDMELTIFFEQALDKNYIKGTISKVIRGYSILMFSKLTFDGLVYIESLTEINKNSKNIFIAFHFTKEMQNIVDNDLKNIIEDMGFNCIRVSTSTTNTDVHINDEIIGKIKSSKIVIADFSGQRNSVYFEAGFAMGLGIPVIWTCKKDEVDKLSFDTRQYPHILWENEIDLAQQIKKRIKAIL